MTRKKERSISFASRCITPPGGLPGLEGAVGAFSSAGSKAWILHISHIWKNPFRSKVRE
jgi:hypothetical protein